MKNKVKIALVCSQHFHKAFPEVKDLTGAVQLRNLDIPKESVNLEKTFHTNGFIDLDFDRGVSEDFLKALNRNDIKLFSFDLGPSCTGVTMKDFYLASGSVLSAEDILRIGTRKIGFIKRNFSGNIALENMDYHPGGAYEHVCKPEFIAQALKLWDAGLVLDIGHAVVSSFVYGMQPRDYIAGLPLERVKEVHFSHAQGNFDLHGLPEEEDYRLLEFILSVSSPEYLVLEYYGDPESIILETKKMADFLRKYD